MPRERSSEPGQEDFETLYARHFGFVWRCLRGLGVAPRALDDAAQDVFVVVHRRLPEFRGESTIPTWLYGIVRNVAANYRRAERRKPISLTPIREPASAAGNPQQRVEDREAAEFVQRFLRGSSEAKREVFVLAVIEQMSVPAVAEILGVPLNTVYTRLRAVRQDFRRALEKRGKP